MGLDVPAIGVNLDSVVDELSRPEVLEDSVELSVTLASAVLVLASRELRDVGLRLSDVASDETLPVLLPPFVAEALTDSVTPSSSSNW